MECAVLLSILSIILLNNVGHAYVQLKCSTLSCQSSTRVHWGGLFGGRNKNDMGKKEPNKGSSGARVTTVKSLSENELKKRREKLEKPIFKRAATDKRLTEPAKVEKPRIYDLQSKGYNYNKADEFPNLYKGWIEKEGDQIGKQMVKAVKAKLKSADYMEVGTNLHPAFPSLFRMALELLGFSFSFSFCLSHFFSSFHSRHVDPFFCSLYRCCSTLSPTWTKWLSAQRGTKSTACKSARLSRFPTHLSVEKAKLWASLTSTGPIDWPRV